VIFYRILGLGLKSLKFQVWTPEASVIQAFVGSPQANQEG